MRIIRKLKSRPLLRGLIPLFVLAHLSHHLLTALPTPLLPFIRDDFGLSYAQSGLVVLAFSLAYGIGQVPAGMITDRVGPRLMITIGICGVAIVGFLVGFSQSFIMLLAFLAVMGLVGASYHPAAAPLITHSVKPEHLGRLLGIHLMGGSGSFFLAPLIAAAVAPVWGWRGAFISLAVPTMIFGIIFYPLLGRCLNRGEATRGATGQSVEETVPSGGRMRSFVAFMVLSVFSQAVLISSISFIPLYMVDHFGVTEGIAAVFLAAIYSAGLWASPLGGYLADRFGTVRVVLTMSFVTSLVMCLLTIIPYGPNGIFIGALLLFTGAILYIRMPAAEAYIMHNSPEHRRSTMLGIYYFANMETGAVFTPLMGSLIDRFNFQTSFTVAGVTALVVTVGCWMFLKGNRD